MFERRCFRKMKRNITLALCIISKIACSDVIDTMSQEQDLFTQDICDKVKIERAIEVVQKDFEDSLKAKYYIASWGLSLAFGMAVATISVYGVGKLAGIEFGKNKLSSNQDILLKCAAIPGVASFICLGHYFSDNITEQKVFEIGKKYDLSAEQCFVFLLYCESFANLFLPKQLTYQYSVQTVPAYYQSTDQFLERYNQYFLKNTK